MFSVNSVDRRVLVFTGATILVATLVAAGSVACARRRRCKKRARSSETPPAQWRKVGCLEEVILYPLKSGKGLYVQQAECMEAGLRTISDENQLSLRDRTFIVFDPTSGAYKTALQQPKMVLITVTSEGADQVRFSAPGAATDLQFQIPGPDSTENPTYCSMWMKEKVTTVDCGEEAAEWVSQYISGKNSGLRLGYSVDGNPKRSIDTAPGAVFKDFYDKLRTGDLGVYSDLTSCMLLGSSSIEDLNTRLPADVKKTTAGNFRPNFVVRGSPAYAEDTWDWVKIGEEAVFRNVKPCTRCHSTTIDPDTGVLDLKYKEPLKTLKTYRKLTDPKAVELDGDSPVMGAHLGVHTRGTVNIGDSVYVGIAA